MKNVILIPDSFKGTMSSLEICAIEERVIKLFFPEANVIKIPVADGGEGSVECFIAALGGEKITESVKGPFLDRDDIKAFRGKLSDGVAVIEMAAAVGLSLAGDEKNPELTSTYGVGQLIALALDDGANRIILGLGGSSTNDGGCGMAAALGVKFVDYSNNEFVPTGGNLKEIDKIDMSGLRSDLANTEIITMCDIDNPFFGEEGAAFIFGPQKGADDLMVKRLDDGLKHLALKIKECTGRDIAGIPGSGAAGGTGGGAVAFLGSRLLMGIETVLDAVGFDELVKGADIVISGEGRIDSQTLRGKTVFGVARRAKAAGVPLLAIVGDIGSDISELYDNGVTAVVSINNLAIPFEEAKQRSCKDLEITMENLMRFAQIWTEPNLKSPRKPR